MERAMILGHEGTALIKKVEAFKSHAYIPKPGDVPTIGFGHTQDVKMGDVVTLEKGIEYFTQDAAHVVQAINLYITIALTQNQFDALVSFVFNIGVKAFHESCVLQKLNEGSFAQAQDEMRKYNKSKNLKGELEITRGLANRREAEIALFNKGNA